MKSSYCKRIAGVLLVGVFSFYFSLLNVYADECTLKSNVDLKTFFGLNVSQGKSERYGENVFDVVLKPNTSNTSLKNAIKGMDFTITKINTATSLTDNSNIGKTVKGNGKITISSNFGDASSIRDENDQPLVDTTGLPFAFYIELKTTEIPDVVKKALFTDDSCNVNSITISSYLTDGGTEIRKKVSGLEPLKIIDKSVYNTIDCDKVDYPKTADQMATLFKYRDNDSKVAESFAGATDASKKFFCGARYLATAAGKAYKNLNNGTKVSGTETMTCSTDVTPVENQNKPGSNDMYIKGADGVANIYNIDANKRFYYGSGTELVHTGEKYWNDSEELTCKVDCEEAVMVEYGPPIAAIAGLCYEYQVKVTSVVSCKMAEAPKEPTDHEVCYPKPTCYGHGATFDQGGPSEDFDRCIKSCDGGKYTSKCSKKCYKQVYGTSSSKKASTLDLDYTTSKMFTGRVSNCNGKADGKYYRDGDFIYFCGKLATWYYHNLGQGHYTVSNYLDGNWFFRNDGIPRATARFSIYHEDCNDECSFSGCDGDPLNDEDVRRIWNEDKAKYERAVKTCENSVACSSSTRSTEFTISLTNDKTVIKFPYELNKRDKEKLTHDCDAMGKADSHNIVLHYGGCYAKCDAKNWYHSHISFPGSWINNKKDGISYKNPSSDSGWEYRPGKICLPVNFKDQNVDWYNHYIYVKQYKPYENNLENSPYTVAQYCNAKVKDAKNPVVDTGNANSPITWNILAKISKFGYFEWNFDVKCFYGLKQQKPDNKTNDDCDSDEECKKCVPGVSNYRIRSVDLANLFPKTDGTDTANNPTEIGREPGFNWSKYAQNNVNSSYSSNPADYAIRVQALGNDLYADSNNIEYEFHLSSEDLREIVRDKNVNRHGSYTEYTKCSKSDQCIKNGVSVYESTLLDMLAARGAVGKKPDHTLLGCNNLANSSACSTN